MAADRSEEVPARADVLERMRVAGRLDLSDHDPRETFGWEKEAARAELAEVVAELADLQKRLFAEEHVSVLPGSFIGRESGDVNPGRNRVRIALVAERAECEETVARIVRFVARHWPDAPRTPGADPA